MIARRWLRTSRLPASYLPLDQVGFGIVERVVDGLRLITLIYLRPCR